MSTDNVVTAQSEDVSGTTLDGVYVSDLEVLTSRPRPRPGLARLGPPSDRDADRDSADRSTKLRRSAVWFELPLLDD